MSSHEPSNYPPPGRSRFPWGCLLTGCGTVFVLGLILFIGTLVGGYYFVSNQIKAYTSDTPRELPKVEYSQEELEEVQARIQAFKQALEKNERPDPLILTADDLNAMISQNEQWRGHVFVRIDNGQVSADLSYPMDAFPLGKGRYFNGSVSTNISLDNGVLIVTLADAEVNGQPVPPAFREAMGQQNLAKDIYKDPEVAKTLSQFESLVVDDDRIVLTPKAEVVPAANPPPNP